MQYYGRYFLLILILLFIGQGILAQEMNTPVITMFGGDLESITPDAAESGTAAVSLWWQTQGMRETDHLVLQVQVLGEWHDVSLPDTVTPLTPNGTLVWTVPHTLTFDPPVFRLLLLDDADHTLSEARYIIPYTVQTYTPGIAVFSSTQTTLTRAELAAGKTVPVQWLIHQRPPNTNLVFEQIVSENVIRNIELPRDNTWIQSSGQGMVRPVQPESDTGEIMLRLRLADIVTDKTYAISDHIPITILDTGTADSGPTPVPPETPNPKIIAFTIDNDRPVRGDTITLSWEVDNVEEVWIGYIHIDFSTITHYGPSPVLEPEGVFGPLPATGTHTFTTPADYPKRGMRFCIGSSVEAIRQLTYVKLVDIRFADMVQPLTVNAFTVDQDSIRRGEVLTLSWDVEDTFDANDTLYISYTGIIQGESMSPYVPQNGRLTGLPAVGSTELIIPDFPPEYNGITFNIGRDTEPNNIYAAAFTNMVE